MWPGGSKQETGEITGKAVAAYFGSVVPDIVSGVGIEQGSKGTKVFASEELSGRLEYKALQFIQCSQESLEEYIINLTI